MNLKDIQSDKLLFDIHAEDLLEKFTARFPEFNEYKGKIDELKVVLYVVLLCDMNSPMRIEKPDLYQRKYTIAHMVKFPMSKKEFTPDAEAIIIGENDIVNQVIVAYITSYGLPSYTLLMAFTALMSYETQKVFGGRATKDSQKDN